MISRREFVASSVLSAVSGSPADPRRLPRKDSFLGFHLDLHPSPADTALGRDVTEEMVEQFLSKTKPDYVQYDCKGVPGLLGYASGIGPSAPGIVNDSLAIWRRVTARRGVSLFIHFCALWDQAAIKDHPEWAAVGADGKPDFQLISTFSAYADERMIPQLKEAIAKYDLDGAWIDCECWAPRPDYSPGAAQAWRAASGTDVLPRKPGDPGWREFLEFHREQFRKHVRHYVDALHAYRPQFQIASNWLYTTFSPEPPTLPVDYLSGDYLGNASISTARLESRYLASVAKPWDLMAWGFHSGGGVSHKPAVQINQEAAVVLAQGGGFQVYYQPTRAGRLDEHLVNTMSKVASFCRERQALSHQSEIVPQIGLVFSKKSLYEYTPPERSRPARRGAPALPPPSPRLFGSWGSMADPGRGLLDALVESHYSVDVLPDWKLAELAARYPLVAVPDWANIGGEVKEILAAHVSKGGKLLLAGAANAALFAKELGIRPERDASDQAAYVVGEEVFGNMRGLWLDVEPGQAEVIERRYPTYDASRDAKCAATLSQYGSGKIAAIYGPIGTVFAQAHAAPVRHFVKRVVDRVFKPVVQVDAPPTLDISLRRKNGKLLLHLANCTAMQVAGEFATSDFVPPVGPLRISVSTPKKPSRVTLEPEGRALAGTWRDGVWTGTVDRVHVHSIVAFAV